MYGAKSNCNDESHKVNTVAMESLAQCSSRKVQQVFMQPRDSGCRVYQQIKFGVAAKIAQDSSCRVLQNMVESEILRKQSILHAAVVYHLRHCPGVIHIDNGDKKSLVLKSEDLKCLQQNQFGLNQVPSWTNIKQIPFRNVTQKGHAQSHRGQERIKIKIKTIGMFRALHISAAESHCLKVDSLG
ncbi:hypothetical protein K435DRAFT_799984 [Dendrothele bispora CBS 962.96]|uniref:Uncharacterized protein n=1 Tax=Dendrothele bispora (strain CBS 962.96) TaxID=1314807 RepID=A0A4S8LU25_DENBC|nr:hypothetical protein K435DRAFT_799984 [Dendrothele bispora CBS 962.96]